MNKHETWIRASIAHHHPAMHSSPMLNFGTSLRDGQQSHYTNPHPSSIQAALLIRNYRAIQEFLQTARVQKVLHFSTADLLVSDWKSSSPTDPDSLFQIL